MSFVCYSLINVSLPLKFVFTICNHVSNTAILIDPFHKSFFESLWTVLLCIGGKAYEVEISLNEVDDHLLPDSLSILSSSIILVLSLDDAFSKVLYSCALWGYSTDVNHFVS